MDSPIVELWFWIVTDEVTKRRRQTRHKNTEQEAKQRHGADAVKVEHSLEIRHIDRDWHTSRFQQPPRTGLYAAKPVISPAKMVLQPTEAGLNRASNT